MDDLLALFHRKNRQVTLVEAALPTTAPLQRPSTTAETRRFPGGTPPTPPDSEDEECWTAGLKGEMSLKSPRNKKHSRNPSKSKFFLFYISMIITVHFVIISIYLCLYSNMEQWSSDYPAKTYMWDVFRCFPFLNLFFFKVRFSWSRVCLQLGALSSGLAVKALHPPKPSNTARVCVCVCGWLLASQRRPVFVRFC